MLVIQDVMDVTFEELSTEQQLQLKEAIEQFHQKCLMSFSKNRGGVSFLKSDMPRVLMLGEPYTTAASEKQEVFWHGTENFGRHNGSSEHDWVLSEHGDC
jgi:hypothetical protein